MPDDLLIKETPVMTAEPPGNPPSWGPGRYYKVNGWFPNGGIYESGIHKSWSVTFHIVERGRNWTSWDTWFETHAQVEDATADHLMGGHQ